MKCDLEFRCVSISMSCKPEPGVGRITIGKSAEVEFIKASLPWKLVGVTSKILVEVE